MNGEEGVLCKGKTGWRFCLLCHGTIVGAEKLLVMEFINSVHDWEEVFISAGGVIMLCNFACFTHKKGFLRGLKSKSESSFWKCLCVSSMSFTVMHINS